MRGTVGRVGEKLRVCVRDAHSARFLLEGWQDTPFRAYLCALEKVWLGPLEVINPNN